MVGEIAGENRRDGAQEQGMVRAARTPPTSLVCLTTLLPQTTSLNLFLKPKDKNAATIFSERERKEEKKKKKGRKGRKKGGKRRDFLKREDLIGLSGRGD